MEAKFKANEERFADAEQVTRPPTWGGYRLVPETIEFWKGRKSRLHDRILFTLLENGEWTTKRLQP